jgi:hypothetical protein
MKVNKVSYVVIFPLCSAKRLSVLGGNLSKLPPTLTELNHLSPTLPNSSTRMFKCNNLPFAIMRHSEHITGIDITFNCVPSL